MNEMSAKELKVQLLELCPRWIQSLVPPLDKEVLKNRLRTELAFRGRLLLSLGEEAESSLFENELTMSLRPDWSSKKVNEYYGGDKVRVQTQRKHKRNIYK